MKKDFRQYSFDFSFGVFDGFFDVIFLNQGNIYNYPAVSINDGTKWLIQDSSELKRGTMDRDLWYCTV